MTSIDEVNTALAALKGEVAVANGKVDTLTTGVLALIKQYQSSVPVTDADLQGLLTKVADITSDVKSGEAKEDAVAAAVAAATTPAPAAAPAADPTAVATST